MKLFITITDTEIMAKEFPPVGFIVPGLLPESGLGVIGGAPKLGKSILMLELALASSYAGRFMNVFEVGCRDVLYLCHEDTEQQVGERIRKMQPDCPASGRIHFAFKIPNNPLASLSEYLDANSNIKIVIIDTLGKFSPGFSCLDYSKQYELFGKLKDMADKRNILIMIVHHLRKSKSDDQFEMLYGSNAVSGAADVIWILQRKRGDDYGTLTVSGRNVPEQILSVKLDRALYSWFVISPMTEELLKKEVLVILEILYCKGTAMKLEEIVYASGFKKPTVSKYLTILINGGYVEKVGYGYYRATHANNTVMLLQQG